MLQRNQTIRLLIVEDNLIFRDLLHRELASQQALEVIGAVVDGESAIQISQELSPDVVLMDIELRGDLTGIEAAREIKTNRPQTGIVVLSSHKDKEYVASVPFEQGSGWSYLLKQSVSDVDTLVRAIDGCAHGLMVVDPELLEDLVPQEGSRLATLTPRQLDVLKFLAQGYNNAGIATRLSLATKSVENYINGIFLRLDVSGEEDVHARVKATLLFLQESRNR